MKKREKRLYTPIVLRTGFMHSYRRTLSLLFSVIVLEAVFWTMAGFWPRFDELGLMRWGLLVILTIIVPIGTSTIRDIVAGYADLFNVFDEKTEESLSLYQSLNRPSSETQKEMQRLFKDNDTYVTFQEKIRKVVFDKTTDTIVIVTIISITAFVSYNTVYEKIILNSGVSDYPPVIMEVVIDVCATLFLIAALSFLFMFGIEYLYLLNQLSGSRKDLRIWSYIQFLQGNIANNRSFLSYWRFLDDLSNIGRNFSGIAFRIILLMTFGGLAQILYNVSTSTVVAWILALFPVILSLLIFVLPLNSLHRVLRDAKDAVLRELEEEYDQLTLRFVTHVYEQRHFHTTLQPTEADKDLAVKITSLRGIIEETRQQSTWPVRAPMVFRIIVTALIPLAYFFVEELILEPWLP